MLSNPTELQKNIGDIIRGHKVMEVIHAFEVIKLDILLNTETTLLEVKK